MLRKHAGSAVWIFIIALLLSACTGTSGEAGKRENSDSPQPSPPDEKVIEEAPVEREPATIVFYSNNNDPVESFDYRFGDTLRKEFPEHEIEYIQSSGMTIEEMLTSNTTFDIFFQSIGKYENFMLPLSMEHDMTELIAKHGVDLNRFEQTIIEAGKQASGGNMYALPIFTSNLVLYYNKALFDKFGVPYPESDHTWEDTIGIANRMARVSDGESYFGMAYSQKHLFRLNPLSIPNANLDSDTPTINTDNRWQTFYQTFFIEPYQEPVVAEYMSTSGKTPDIFDFTDHQRVALFPYLSSLIYAWEDRLQLFDWDIVALPSFSTHPGVGSPSYPTYFGITKLSENKDAAMEVLKFMVSDDFQMELARKGIMPVLSNDKVLEVFGSESPFKDKNLMAVFEKEFAPNAPKALYDAQLIDLYTSYGVRVQKGEMDLNSALRTAEEEALQIISEFNQ